MAATTHAAWGFYGRREELDKLREILRRRDRTFGSTTDLDRRRDGTETWESTPQR